MHAAVRPYATAGVALVGASVIAVSPIVPPLPDIQVHNPAAHLAALADPFQAYTQVFQEAVGNLQSILATAAANPTPVLTQILKNQIASLQDILAALAPPVASSPPTTPALANPTTTPSQIPTSLQTTAAPGSGNVEDAVNNALLAAVSAVFPLTNLIPPLTAAITSPLQNLVDAINTLGPIGVVLANPLQNVVNVLNALSSSFSGLPATNAQIILAGLTGPLIQGVAATGAAIQGVIDAIGTGNPTAVLGAIIDAPAVIAGGVLNGGFGPDLSTVVGIPGVTILAGGLLNPFELLPEGPTGITVNLPGTVPALQMLQNLIAGALKPPPIATAADAPLQPSNAGATNAPTALPNPTATTMTLQTTPTPETTTPAGDPTGGTGANASPAAAVTGATTTPAGDPTGGTGANASPAAAVTGTTTTPAGDPTGGTGANASPAAAVTGTTTTPAGDPTGGTGANASPAARVSGTTTTPAADPSGGTGANASPATRATGTTSTSAAGRTDDNNATKRTRGNNVTGGNGTKETGGKPNSTVSKTAARQTGGAGDEPEHASHE